MHTHPFLTVVFNTFQRYPGKFMLSYLPRTSFCHEYITVIPEGFRFRQRVFGSIGSLFRWFKDNFREPILGTASTPRGAATSRTPYNGTANVNLAGTCMFYVTENTMCFFVVQ
jgi:transcription elongation factor SPT6